MNSRKAKKIRHYAEKAYDAMYGRMNKKNKVWEFIKIYIIGIRIFNRIPGFKYFYRQCKKA